MTNEVLPVHDIAAAIAHGVVGERGNEAAIDPGRGPLVCGFARRRPR